MARRAPAADNPNNFFPGMKRKLTLDGWSPKHNSEGEKRALLQFEMPLTGETATGHPNFIKPSFLTMEKEDSAEKSIELAAQFEGVSIEFYDTADSRSECYTINGATLQSFEMGRIADGESHITVLRFSATVPRSIPLLTFLHKYERKTLWAEFEATQTAISQDKTQMRLSEQKAS